MRKPIIIPFLSGCQYHLQFQDSDNNDNLMKIKTLFIQKKFTMPSMEYIFLIHIEDRVTKI